MRGIREKIWVFSDDRRELLICQIPGRGARPSIAPPRKVSHDLAKKQNEKAECRQLARKLEANFTKSDRFITLTYETAPKDRQAAEKDLNNFTRNLRELLKKRGETLKYIKTTGRHGRGRLHHHLVLSGNVTRSEIEKIWKNGKTQCRHLRKDGKDSFFTLAKYIYKHGADRERGKPAYRCSRNLKKPIVKISDDSVHALDFRRLDHAWANEGEYGLKRELARLHQGWYVPYAYAGRNPVTGMAFFGAVLQRQPGAAHSCANLTPFPPMRSIAACRAFDHAVP